MYVENNNGFIFEKEKGQARCKMFYYVIGDKNILHRKRVKTP